MGQALYNCEWCGRLMTQDESNTTWRTGVDYGNETGLHLCSWCCQFVSKADRDEYTMRLLEWIMYLDVDPANEFYIPYGIL
jgi:hypothetical protein